MLKSHRVSKSSYHGFDLEENNARRLAAKGLIVFDETKKDTIDNDPAIAKNDKFELAHIKHARLSALFSRGRFF